MTRTLATAAAGALLALGIGSATPALSQDYYMGEIMVVSFTFCPKYTMEANGALLPIAQNTALFSLLGTTYGGNGTTTFALPDLRGRSPIGQGAGPGLTPVVLGQMGGSETVTLNQTQLPAHTHPVTSSLVASESAATSGEPEPGSVLSAAQVYGPAPGSVPLGGLNVTVGPAGNNQPVSIRDPYLAIRYCIVSSGIYPPRP